MSISLKSWKRVVRSTISAIKPEEYWINLGSSVVGNMTREQMLVNRQIDTYRAICRLIAETSTRRVADLGCNVSVLGVLLREDNYRGEYIGVDSNSNALTIARNNLGRYRFPYEHVQANLRQLDFADRAFETVVLKDVLEHMEDFRPVLGEALRVAGRYALVANFIPWTEGDTIIRREPAGYYHNLYARRETYQFIAQAGFDVLSVTSTMEKESRPNEVVFLARRQ
jgi:ubiquinone/menaquinone biosynthesis C-methylase UbiE